MRSQIEKLHSAARQYCIEKSRYWRSQYFELITIESMRGSDSALNLFPRYNYLDTILIGLEEFTPDDFASFSEAKELIIMAGYTSGSLFTVSQNAIEKNVMQQEREAFCKYIKNLNQEQIEYINPLFYRKVLTETESQKLWGILKKKWDIQTKSYWHPLMDSPINDVIVFQEEPFDIKFGIENIRKILQRKCIQKVFSLTEYGPEYELDVSVFEPLYYHSGVENYSFSQQADWVIYASHEGAITVGGKWLIDEIKTIWTDWGKYIWKSTFEDDIQ